MAPSSSAIIGGHAAVRCRWRGGHLPSGLPGRVMGRAKITKMTKITVLPKGTQLSGKHKAGHSQVVRDATQGKVSCVILVTSSTSSILVSCIWCTRGLRRSHRPSSRRAREQTTIPAHLRRSPCHCHRCCLRKLRARNGRAPRAHGMDPSSIRRGHGRADGSASAADGGARKAGGGAAGPVTGESGDEARRIS